MTDTGEHTNRGRDETDPDEPVLSKRADPAEPADDSEPSDPAGHADLPEPSDPADHADLVDHADLPDLPDLPDLSEHDRTSTLTRRLWALLRSPKLVALLLGILTVLGLLGGEANVGYVRDEGIYLEASRHYGAWMARWVEDGPEANKAEVRDRYFALNHEHPALMKIAAGVSARLLARPPAPEIAADIDALKSKRTRVWRRELAVVDGGLFPRLREGAAMRLPAMALAGLAVGLLFLVGHRVGGGTVGGLLCSGWFLLLPRVQFHASLHAFDLPIAVLTLVMALAWLRALDDWRWGLALGPLLGIAISIKHNALFLGPLFALHLWLCLSLRWALEGERPSLRQALPLPLLSMLVLGPLVAVALWPWLWTDTATRISEYFAFHSEHSYYNMEFGGVNYNRPPLPIAYPFVMTWATVPTVLLTLTGMGALLALRTLRIPGALAPFARAGSGPTRSGSTSSGPGNADGSASPTRARWWAPLPVLDGREEPLLFVGMAVFPLVLIALPSIPIFGGTKHWLTAYPFMAMLAAMAWGRLWMRARAILVDYPRLLSVGPSLLLVAVLTPGAWATVHGHPFNLSQYAPLMGGSRGAAQAGLNRGFWGHALVPLLDEREALPPGPTYVHDVHRMAIAQYRREGRWPGWRPSGANRAEVALIFPERHTLSDEIQVWESTGSTAPTMVLTLDDVPVAIVYQRSAP